MVASISFSPSEVGNQNNNRKTDHNTDCQIVNPVETVMPQPPHRGILDLGMQLCQQKSVEERRQTDKGGLLKRHIATASGP